jgi:hypothetical protein
MISTGENRRTRRKPCPSDNLSTTNPARTGLRGERPATNDLSHDTAFKTHNYIRTNGRGVKRGKKVASTSIKRSIKGTWIRKQGNIVDAKINLRICATDFSIKRKNTCSSGSMCLRLFKKNCHRTCNFQQQFFCFSLRRHFYRLQTLHLA